MGSQIVPNLELIRPHLGETGGQRGPMLSCHAAVRELFTMAVNVTFRHSSAYSRFRLVLSVNHRLLSRGISDGNRGEFCMNGLLRFLLLGGGCCAVAAMATPSLGAAADASGGANTVKAGVEAWSAGQYETAVQLWKPLADKGDADAQFNLAQAYKMGRGVPLDLARAESLYGKAAAHGHVQAADNYGLLMFQRGERDAAMPYIAAASARGDARAQYILGVAHFNGDLAEKDWVRAYALVSLAQQAGLPQATRALTQMDEHIPIEQRQQGVALAVKLAADAEAARARLDTSASLGAPATARAAPPPPPSPTASPTGPAAAGADYARPQATAAPQPVRPISNPAVTRPSVTRPAVPSAVTKPAATTAPKPFPAKPATPSPAQGQWRLQLGAFGVPGNAERLWSSLAKRPELAGKRRELVPGGSLTRLYAAGFATRSEAEKACAALKGPSQPCLVVPAH